MLGGGLEEVWRHHVVGDIDVGVFFVARKFCACASMAFCPKFRKAR